MSQRELVTSVFEKLERLGVASMLTGSHAAGVYGTVRATHDIDIVVDLRPAALDAIMAEFAPSEFYLSRAAVEEAIRECGEFNAIHHESGVKVDFWILKRDAFSRSAFARRRVEQILGRQIAVCSPEDLITQKLAWARACGGSEKQMYDCVRVFEVQHKSLDIAYIEHWAQTLGLLSDWRRVLETAQIDDD